MPNYSRDVTASGGTDSFVGVYDGLYWFYNPTGNSSFTLAKSGKAPQTISPGEVAVVYLARGEEISLTGTVGQSLSVYDHFDVKLIPSAKDVLGKVQIVDSTGANLLAVDSSGRITVLQGTSPETVGGTLGTIDQAIAIPATTARGINVRVIPDTSSRELTVGIDSAKNSVQGTMNQGNPNAGGALAWPVKGGHATGDTPGTDFIAVLNVSDTTGKLNILTLVASNFLFSPGDVPVAVDGAASTGLLPVTQNLLGANDKPDVSVNQTNPLKIKPLATLVEQQSFAPTSVAAATAEGIVNTGAVTLALGQRVAYNLSGEPGTVTGAGLFIYVAVKGATSGNYYAVCQSGASVSGFFTVSQAEKLNIVRRNSDGTNAHVLSGYWQAMSP